MATDPVCKMKVEPAKAAAHVDYQGQEYGYVLPYPREEPTPVEF